MLMSFMSAGVIDVSVLDPRAPEAFFEDTDGTYVWDGDTNIVASPMREPYGDAVISNLNAQRYEQQCQLEGLHPYADTYSATMDIIGIGTPVVRVGRKQFVFNSTKTDSYKELLLSYLKDNPEKQFSLTDIQKVQGFSAINNLNETVENSYISQVLSPFIQITKSSVIFKPNMTITREQLDSIAKRSKKS